MATAAATPNATTVGVQENHAQLGSVQFDFEISVAPVATSRGTVGDGTGEIEPSTNMELRTWKVVDGTGRLQSAYWSPNDSSKTLVYQDAAFGADTYDNWRVYSVTVSVVDDRSGTGENNPGQTKEGIFYSQSDILAALSGKTYDLDVARTANHNSIAMFWVAADTTNLTNTKTVSGGSDTRNIADDHSYTASQTYYFGMYVDGDLHNTAKATSDIAAATGDFTVSLTHNA